MTLPLEELCKGQPQEFVSYLRIVRNLKFTEQPPYEQLRQLFVDFRTRHCGGNTDWQSTLTKRDKPLGDDTVDVPMTLPALAPPTVPASVCVSPPLALQPPAKKQRFGQRIARH